MMSVLPPTICVSAASPVTLSSGAPVARVANDTCTLDAVVGPPVV
jgi:hypothetical protein